LVTGFREDHYALAIAVSVKRLLKGYLVSLSIGIPLGVLIGRIKLLSETVGSLILGFQTLPSICWLPLAILWFGLGEKPIIFVVIIGAIFSVLLSTEAGVKNVPPLYIRAAKTMGTKGWRIYTSVLVPAALPSIITGMKLAWSFSWRALMAGELLSPDIGLGQILMMGRDLADINQVVSVMVMITVLGLAIDRILFINLEASVRRKWGLEG